MKYKVNIESDYISGPEESLILPVDEKLHIGRLLTGKFFRWIYLFTFLFFILVILLVFNLEVQKGKYYSEQAFGNEYVSFPLRPYRGTIFDKNLNIIADNLPSYDLIIFKRELLGDYLKELSQILNKDFSELSSLIENNQDGVIFIENISQNQAEEIRTKSYPDIYVAENTLRHYNDGLIFSHITGYVSEVNENDLGDEFYEPKDFIGKSGIELVYEKYLKGQRGYFQIPRLYESEPLIIPHNKGNDIILSIDSELQEILFKNLKKGLDIAGSTRGAGIIQNPNTGEILALVSLPTFNSNTLVKGIDIDEYSRLINNKSKPLLNRVISGKFSPGSTIKPLFALAALKEELIDPFKRIHTTGSISVVNPYDPNIVYTFRDWKNHGSVNMFEAIANSVDVYFYMVGGGYKDFEGLGIDRMSAFLKDFWAGKKLGIDLPGEISGLVPTRAFKKEVKKESWYIGDSYNVSIGQGDLLVTPLWINAYISAIANDGKIYRPFIVSKIIDENGDYVKIFEGEILNELYFGEDNLNLVKRGMRMAVTDGTIKRYLDELPIKVAAKTGTAEVIKGQTTNSFVTLFAPYENPEIAMTILVEDAQEALSVAPFVAKGILEQYFSGSN